MGNVVPDSTINETVIYLLWNFVQDENLQRCSISADSQIENSGSEESTDDENIDTKDNGYHDAENEVDPETDDDPERVHSGKLSESSGYAGSDLYDYKVVPLFLGLYMHDNIGSVHYVCIFVHYFCNFK